MYPPPFPVHINSSLNLRTVRDEWPQEKMDGVKRRSTVHDLASLRLHPDGTKVVNTETNLRPRKAKYVVKDASGNWVARDAGGVGRVKKRRAATEDARQTDGEDEEENAAVGPSSSAVNKGKGRATEENADTNPEDEANREKVVKDIRAKRRKAYEDDLDFLDSRNTSSPNARLQSALAKPAQEKSQSCSANTLPLPSSVSSVYDSVTHTSHHRA